MREATPYVKKGSPVSEIGWETPPPESPRLGCASADPLSQLSLSIHRDKKTIPLKMCYVTRNMTVSDPENRWVKDLGLWNFAFALNRCWPFQCWGWWGGAGDGLWPHTETQRGASKDWFGKSGWWCLSCVVLVQLLGCARETLQCGNPIFLLEIESQEFVFILIKCLLLKEKTLYTLIGYIFRAGLI